MGDGSCTGGGGVLTPRSLERTGRVTVALTTGVYDEPPDSQPDGGDDRNSFGTYDWFPGSRVAGETG